MDGGSRRGAFRAYRHVEHGRLFERGFNGGAAGGEIERARLDRVEVILLDVVGVLRGGCGGGLRQRYRPAGFLPQAVNAGAVERYEVQLLGLCQGCEEEQR